MKINIQKKSITKKDILENLVNTILNFDLQNWEHFSKIENRPFQRAYNGNNGRPYNGINDINLTLNAFLKKYTNPYFVTINQAKKIGADFKGERAEKVFFASNYYLHKQTKKLISDENFTKLPTDEKENYNKKSSFTSRKNS